jgi:hypothetical protein
MPNAKKTSPRAEASVRYTLRIRLVSMGFV